MRRFLPRPTSSKAYVHHIPMTGPAHAVPEPPSTARIRAIIVARMARTSVYQTSRSDCRQVGSNPVFRPLSGLAVVRPEPIELPAGHSRLVRKTFQNPHCTRLIPQCRDRLFFERLKQPKSCVQGGWSPTRQLYSSKQFGVVFGVGTRKRACGSESSSVDCIFAHRQWASTTWLRSRLLGQMPQKPDTGLPTK